MGLEEPLASEMTLVPVAIVMQHPRCAIISSYLRTARVDAPATIFQETAFMFVPIVTVSPPLFRLTSCAYPVVVAAH